MRNLFRNFENGQNIKVAYIHTMTYPSAEANALQAIKMAAAFSKMVDTTFFVPRLKTSKLKLKQLYEISDSPLQIFSMSLDLFPSGFRINYEKCISFFLRFHPQWNMYRGQKILFFRTPKELLYWGLQRESQKWLRDWTFVFEAHDVLGLDPNQFQNTNPFDLQDGIEGRRSQLLLQALLNLDLVVCVTQALADDLKAWSNNKVQPQVVRHASPLSRTSSPPQIRFFGKNITLGYIGTIDQYRGVNIILEAMRLLPKNYTLRIVGRMRKEKDVASDWLNKYLNDPLIRTRVELKNVVPIHKVAGEIDRCDIVLQPASNDIIDTRYASPLKSYDYMMRGKPIVAADVPCHHELFQDGENAILYSVTPQHLADRITYLGNNPDHAERIARAGWEQAVDFTYSQRAHTILSFAKSCNKKIL